MSKDKTSTSFLEVSSRSAKNKDRYYLSVVDVHVKSEHDTDINLKLPDGNTISIQYRPESNTLDICLENSCLVHNWGPGMSAAPKEKGAGSHVRKAEQICIDLDES